MSARWPRDGGGFITGIDAANDADFTSSLASPSGPRWTGPKRLRGVYPADIGEVLGAAEDLWLRIANQPEVHGPVLSTASTGARLVIFRFDANGRHPECCQLLAAASSGDSYLWSQDGSRGSLVSDVQWQGNALVIELTAARQMRRWPEGEAVDWQVQALLNRMQAMGRAL